CQQYNNYPHSF
nr:immunoglobulin light chain junction region [Macaca mulatta]